MEKVCWQVVNGYFRQCCRNPYTILKLWLNLGWYGVETGQGVSTPIEIRIKDRECIGLTLVVHSLNIVCDTVWGWLCVIRGLPDWMSFPDYSWLRYCSYFVLPHYLISLGPFCLFTSDSLICFTQERPVCYCLCFLDRVAGRYLKGNWWFDG